MVRRAKKRPSKRTARSKPAARAPVAMVRPEGVTPAEAAGRALWTNKIFPRNLTAQAAYLVPGNPVVTRPEDAVANCFPGLELDIRNLDRRFFPGLVFNFIKGGARLEYVDAFQDPDLQTGTPEANKLYVRLADDAVQQDLACNYWFLDWIEQGGKHLSMHWQGDPMDDTMVWRLVRSLELGPVTIGLKYRKADDAENAPNDEDLPDQETYTFHGWRRRFTDPKTGAISGAYQPGELMQGLCSPWQHDFRDCACFYWAANHPDIVLGELYPGEASLPSGPAAGGANPENTAEPDPTLASVPIDWLRVNRERSLAGEALETIPKNRLYQIDHFQINSIWQNLNVVVEGREIGGLYLPQSIDNANPYSSPVELANELRTKLGPLEIALTFEYLYARFSLISEAEAKRNNLEMLHGAVLLARERLLLVAASEMQHLRWVNQLLWDLMQAKLIPPGEFVPVLTPATEIPTIASLDREAASMGNFAGAAQQKNARKDAVDQFTRTERSIDTAPPAASGPVTKTLASANTGNPHALNGVRAPALRPLAPDVLGEFIAVEHPSAYIDGAYSRVVATLRQPIYPPSMVELALRIVSDGVQHETRFQEVKAALSPFFDNPIYLRKNFKVATKAEARTAAAPIKAIKEHIRSAYIAAARNQFETSVGGIAKARDAMNQLLQAAEDLADKKLGVPFFDLWNDIP